MLIKLTSFSSRTVVYVVYGKHYKQVISRSFLLMNRLFCCFLRPPSCPFAAVVSFHLPKFTIISITQITMLLNPACDWNADGPRMQTDEIASSIRLPTPAQNTPNYSPSHTYLKLKHNYLFSCNTLKIERYMVPH